MENTGIWIWLKHQSCLVGMTFRNDDEEKREAEGRLGGRGGKAAKCWREGRKARREM